MGGLSRGLLQVLLLILVSTTAFNAQAAYTCSSLFEESSQRSIANVASLEARTNELKIGTYNMLNFFMETQNARGKSQKPRWAIEEIAKVLKQENYDILVAQEIESLATAKKFSHDFLNDQYEVYSTTTKDKRGLYVVFFVKRSLPYQFKVESHAEETWFDPIKNEESFLFERDLPTLHIYRNAGDEVPMLTMLGAHFKSKRHRSGNGESGTTQDFESNILREAQANRATQIIQRYQMKFGYDHPILIAGDFNSNHNYAPEYYGFLRHAKLSDTVGLKDGIESYTDRTTHAYFGGKRPSYNQLDGILITPSLTKYLKASYVVKYRDAQGNEMDIAKTKAERNQAPSDHRPITAVFYIEDLRK